MATNRGQGNGRRHTKRPVKSRSRPTPLTLSKSSCPPNDSAHLMDDTLRSNEDSELEDDDFQPATELSLLLPQAKSAEATSNLQDAAECFADATTRSRRVHRGSETNSHASRESIELTHKPSNSSRGLFADFSRSVSLLHFILWQRVNIPQTNECGWIHNRPHNYLRRLHTQSQ